MLQFYKTADGSMPSIDWDACGLSNIRNKKKSGNILTDLSHIPEQLKDIKTKLLYNRKKLLDGYCLNGCNNWNILHREYLDDFIKTFTEKNKQIQEQLTDAITKYKTINDSHRDKLIKTLTSQNLTQPQVEYAVEYLLEKTLPPVEMLKTWGYTMFPPIAMEDYLNICPSGEYFIDDLLHQTSQGMINDLFILIGTVLHAYQVQEINGKYVHTMEINIGKIKKYIPYLTSVPGISGELIDLVNFTQNITTLTESKIKGKLLKVKKTWANYLINTNLTTTGEQRLLTAIIPTIPNPTNRYLTYWSDPEQKAKYLAQLNDYI